MIKEFFFDPLFLKYCKILPSGLRRRLVSNIYFAPSNNLLKLFYLKIFKIILKFIFIYVIVIVKLYFNNWSW